MKRNHLVFCAGLMFLSACASKQTQSTQTQKDLEAQLVKQVGVARKADLIETYGEADWCQRGPGGAETCRFIKVVGEKWLGPKKFQKKTTMKDEVLAEFAPSGTLRSFNVNSQR